MAVCQLLQLSRLRNRTTRIPAQTAAPDTPKPMEYDDDDDGFEHFQSSI